MLPNVPHQIVQSPARLGLTNANSPSLQNSTPPKFPSQPSTSHLATQQPNQSNALSTSSSLLPLLPPLPRAQAILLQMASLAPKLFEVSPNRAQWITSFRGSLPSFLSSQVQSAAPPPLDSSPSSPKEILTLFSTLQTQLFEAVAELQEILDLQDAKQKLAREIRSKDMAVRSFANKLIEAEEVLDNLMDDYSDYRRPKRSKLKEDSAEEDSLTSASSQLKLSDLLSYAHRISYTTFAPPEFGAGAVPLRGALPPAPQDEQMRASLLYKYANLDVGLPKRDDGKENIIEPLIEIPAEISPHGQLPGLQSLLPPNIVVPAGWKPGMPVELPIDMPMPPPGWKPGDPVTLPPLDNLPALPRMEDLQPRQVPPVLGRPPEPIQVRHVQLDIEDDSSDYSSDMGSSDSED